MDLQLIKETNNKWGFDYMTSLCMEEFSEVIQAISKIRRKIMEAKGEFTIEQEVDHLNEEIADCLICIEELKDLGIVDNERVEKWIKFKQDRQRIRNK